MSQWLFQDLMDGYVKFFQTQLRVPIRRTPTQRVLSRWLQGDPSSNPMGSQFSILAL